MPDNDTVHIVDDDLAVRQSLAFLLATTGRNVRVYDSALSFMNVLDDVKSGCLVTDVRMPGVDGFELLKRVKRNGVLLPVIVMTGHADIPLAVQAMKDGAVDFIEKPFDDERFLSAVEAALHLVPTSVIVSRETQTRIDSLSEREHQVLDGILMGKPNKIIAYDLGLSQRTVEVYRANVMTKMHADNLPELVRKALSVRTVG